MTPVRSAAPLAPGRWTVSPERTRATFQVRDVLHRPVRGMLSVTAGSVHVDEHGVPMAVHAQLDLATVDTANPRRDKDLQGASFLDVRRSALLLFTGGPASAAGPHNWTLPGCLSMKGVQCPVEIEVEVTAADTGHLVRATTVVDRRRLGIGVPRLLVGSSVAITVEAGVLPPDPG